MPFRLVAHTPMGKIIDETVDEAYFPTDKGPLGIYEDYDPMIISIQDGVMKYTKSGKSEFYAVFGGALWIEKDQVMVLTELLENAKDIDLAKEKLAKENAENLIVHSSDRFVIQQGEAALRMANVRIAAKTNYGGFEK